MSALAVYLSLFFSAFLAATIVPLQSEAVLVVALLGEHSPLAVIAVASVGNVLGAVVKLGLPIRVGLHTGEIALEANDDVAGIAVAIAARVAALANADEVLVSSTVRDLVAGSGLKFTERGLETLKGIDEPMRIFLAA